MSASAAKRRRLVGPDFVAELVALAGRANALSACLPAQLSESERHALAALQAACSGLDAAVAVSLEQSLLLRLPSDLLVRVLGFLDAAGMATVCGTFSSGSTLVTEALPLAAARTASPATVAVVPRGRGEVAWLRCLEAARTLADGWGGLRPLTTHLTVTAPTTHLTVTPPTRDAAARGVLMAAFNESVAHAAHAPQRRLLGYANPHTYHPSGVYSEVPTVELLRTNPAAGGGTAVELLTAALVEAYALYEDVGKVVGRLVGFVALQSYERVGVVALVELLREHGGDARLVRAVADKLVDIDHEMRRRSPSTSLCCVGFPLAPFVRKVVAAVMGALRVQSAAPVLQAPPLSRQCDGYVWSAEEQLLAKRRNRCKKATLSLVELVHQLSLYDMQGMPDKQQQQLQQQQQQQQQLLLLDTNNNNNNNNNNTPSSSSSSSEPTATSHARKGAACGLLHRQWRAPLLASGVLELMTSLQQQVDTWQQDSSKLKLQDQHEVLVDRVHYYCKNIQGRLCTPSVNGGHEHPLTLQKPWDVYPEVNEAEYQKFPCFCDVCQRPIFDGHAMYHCSQGCHFDACKACHDGMM